MSSAWLLTLITVMRIPVDNLQSRLSRPSSTRSPFRIKYTRKSKRKSSKLKNIWLIGPNHRSILWCLSSENTAATSQWSLPRWLKPGTKSKGSSKFWRKRVLPLPMLYFRLPQLPKLWVDFPRRSKSRRTSSLLSEDCDWNWCLYSHHSHLLLICIYE